jgi:hypothetical protein
MKGAGGLMLAGGRVPIGRHRHSDLHQHGRVARSHSTLQKLGKPCGRRGVAIRAETAVIEKARHID